jgi:protein-tyrosine phosphatase
MSKPKNYTIEEVVDKNFHHAALVTADVEWDSILNISNIKPYVYIGNFQDSLNLKTLQDNKIRVIISVTPNDKDPITLEMYKNNRILHKWLELDNVPDAPIENVWDTAYNLISRCVREKCNVLIHCMQGVSSAPAIVVYHILRGLYTKYDAINSKPDKHMLPGAIEVVKSKRQCISINYGFLEKLEDCEAKLMGISVNPNASLSTRRNKKLMAILKSELEKNVQEELRRQREGVLDPNE